MEIEPQYIDLACAKLLKDKNIDVACKMSMSEDDDRPLTFDTGKKLHINSKHPYISAPEIWQVIEWASLEHNTDIEARPIRYAGDEKTSYYQAYINGCSISMNKYTVKKDAYLTAIKQFLNELI